MAEPTEAPRQQQQQEQSLFSKYGGQLLQFFVIWWAVKLVTNGFSSNQNNAPTESPLKAVPAGEQVVLNHVGASLRDYTQGVPANAHYFPLPQVPASNLASQMDPLWPKGLAMDLCVYATENPFFTDYKTKPLWCAENIIYGENIDDNREFHVDLPVSKTLQNNGTLYAHVFLTAHGSPINPRASGFDTNKVSYLRHELTKFYPKKTKFKQKNLLAGSADEAQQEEPEEEIVEEHAQADTQQQAASGGFGMGLLTNLTRQAPLVAYWHENVTFAIITDALTRLPKANLQPPVLKYLPLEESLSVDASGKTGFYKPIVYPHEFWQLRQNAYPVNDTITVLPLTIHVQPMTMWKFNIFAAMSESMSSQANNPMGGMSSGEMDEVKRMFLETNPVLLAVTISVSILHSVFEMLAFKNDIQFWKKKDNSTGVSVRSIIVNIFFQLVIFLYLMDNNAETSMMILFGQGMGLLIEVWKVFKALKYELVWTPGRLLPTLAAQKVETTQEEDETAKYDAIAFKYLTWISYPLLGGYAIYSLYYEEHKSWYSFVLKTLVEFVYLFGFITMIPQLYINYRLKSVAHMPWKTLMYKSLNTFIDDLFAFVIKMPTLHRIACLRDDAVFLVYIYQRYKYKVDHTRANEYGQVGDDTKANDDAKNTDKKDAESKKDK
ncbi:cleft lip and palate transmembrane 1 [Hesseltinella vesiculosa]|uniref:Cleft lip and palate transmembrane 1 n=1 Tax=Hesseltinella vesiculosa TaxID=101127 RepID=A0A1X2GQT7_9FUNG|nr:cleft lip and palate transmembrane 1 [Hesseltinella vesiculosa]